MEKRQLKIHSPRRRAQFEAFQIRLAAVFSSHPAAARAPRGEVIYLAASQSLTAHSNFKQNSWARIKLTRSLHIIKVELCKWSCKEVTKGKDASTFASAFG